MESRSSDTNKKAARRGRLAFREYYTIQVPISQVVSE